MLFNWITPRILEISFDDPYTLCDTTYLFSHFYEDPKWHGKLTTREELDAWYKAHHGAPDYWKKRWAGSNLPDWVFESFRSRKDLKDSEKEILKQLGGRLKPFYVIMTTPRYSEARKHEIAHALWYTESEYQRKAKEILFFAKENLDSARCILSTMYSQDVLLDELHVYCGIYYQHYLAPQNISVREDIVQALSRLFKEYYNKGKLSK